MGGMLFASDLDNTLLFSYKHKLDTDRCVELLEGREQGFCTEHSLDLLALVRERMWFVPVTTRSVAQYRRIVWPTACVPRYVVAANGGILLVDGTIDEDWYEHTQRLIAPWQDELLEMQGRLSEAPELKRCRMVDGLYLFASCDNASDARTGGAYFAGQTSLEVAVSGRKVYFFPPPLNKGEAVRRLMETFMPSRTICAGDSVIDVPMLRAADVAIVPNRELLEEEPQASLRLCGDEKRFPDFVLEAVLDEYHKYTRDLKGPDQS